jgi:hypothetical protein
MLRSKCGLARNSCSAIQPGRSDTEWCVHRRAHCRRSVEGLQTRSRDGPLTHHDATLKRDELAHHIPGLNSTATRRSTAEYQPTRTHPSNVNPCILPITLRVSTRQGLTEHSRNRLYVPSVMLIRLEESYSADETGEHRDRFQHRKAHAPRQDCTRLDRPDTGQPTLRLCAPGPIAQPATPVRRQTTPTACQGTH